MKDMTVTSLDRFISIQNVSKKFGEFQAVSDVSLDIKRGEFFSLLGASGCGKTTLLRMLAGLEGTSNGEILIDDAPMSDVAPHHRPVNMVFQSYAIFPHLNVRDNIAYGLRKERLSKAEKFARVDEMLELIKLPGYGLRKAGQLSGGQRQRIALARALILRPKVLLLDEPLGALDKQLREQMQLELRALQRKIGITFVFVTHDQEEALTLSDRIAVMSGGRVLQVDTPAGLYERPQSQAVASFIGNMNFFDATVLEKIGETAVVQVQGLGNMALPTSDVAVDTGGRFQVGLRPEKFHLSMRKPDDDAAIEGQLDTTAYLGERSHHYVSISGKPEPVAVSSPNWGAGSGETSPLVGAKVWLSWSSKAVVVLTRADDLS
jgi:spermidine/putrescine transport system ATP-binding protein/putrescine transport system ATP-binding protein